MGVITSQVFMGYTKFVKQPRVEADAKREAESIHDTNGNG
jgi:hypothetical protein